MSDVKRLDDAKLQFVEQLRGHSFLTRCRQGTITLDELKVFLVEQGFYSSYFTRYLCALMSNLPSNHEVLLLGQNLFEELGLGEGGSTPHHLIYRDMLGHFGLSLDGATPARGTLGLINTMLHHCRHPNAAFGLGAICLGAEALVPHIYSDLISGFTACGVAPEHIEFFRIHVECDDGHAQTIRDIMLSLAEGEGSQIDIMLTAGQALVDARWRFFDDCESKALELQA